MVSVLGIRSDLPAFRGWLGVGDGHAVQVGEASPVTLWRNKSWVITAEVEIPAGGAEGMIVTEGGRFGGYALLLSGTYEYWLESLWLRTAGVVLLLAGLLRVLIGRLQAWSFRKSSLGYGMLMLGLIWGVAVVATRTLNLGKSKPVFVYNLLDLKRTIWEGPSLDAGKHAIVFDFKSDGPGLGKGGMGMLSVDGHEVARKSMESSTPVTFPEDETFDIGEDTRTGVALLEYRYDVPFKFTGNINKLSFKLEPQPEETAQR